MPAKMNDVCPYCEEHLHDMTDGVAASHIKECRDIHKADFGISDMIDFFSSGDDSINVVVFDEKGPRQVKKK